jgi:hypothetical protein
LKYGEQVEVVLVCAAAAGQSQAMPEHTLEKLFALVNDKVVAHLFAV